MASTTCEIVSLCWLLEDIGVTMPDHMPMYCDNKSAIQIAKNEVFHERTKHIEVDCHVVCYHFKTTGTISLPYISSSNQKADLFTMSHIVAYFQYLVDKLWMFMAS